MTLDEHMANVRRKFNRGFIRSTEEVARSVRFGSEVTGAAGQPVKTSALLQSWQDEFVSDTEWKMSATGTANIDGKEVDVGYAKHVEDNVRGVTFSNHGAHSVKDTVLGWPKIVAVVAAEVNGA